MEINLGNLQLSYGKLIDYMYLYVLLEKKLSDCTKIYVVKNV